MIQGLPGGGAAMKRTVIARATIIAAPTDATPMTAAARRGSRTPITSARNPASGSAGTSQSP